MKLDLDDESTTDYIASLKPYQIDWSNIPDYIHQTDFIKLAQRCSVADTAHTAHFMNWVIRVFGTHPLDFGENMQNAYQSVHEMSEKNLAKVYSLAAPSLNSQFI